MAWPSSLSAPAGLGARLDAASFGLLLVALVWAPWPLASNRPWAVALLAVLVWCGVVLCACAAVLQGRHVRPSGGPAAWLLPPLALLSFAVLLVAQLVAGPPHGGGAQAATLLPYTISPFHTQKYLLTALAYLGAWLLVLGTVQSRLRAQQLLAGVLAAGVLQALAAVLLYSTDASYDLWGTHFDQGGRAMGTYPNPDNLAGYMELALSAGLGWLLSQLGGGDQPTHRHWRSRVVAALAFVMSTKMLLRLLLVVLVIALVMTHSRMGNGAFFISLVLTGLLVAARSPSLRRPALWLVASMALVDVFIIGQWVGLDRVVQRLQNTVEASSNTMASFGLNDVPPPREESIAQRLRVPMLSLQLVRQSPWFGHGGGTYATAFPPYKQAGLPWQWDQAHNDYVQIACDTGLVGLALLLVVALSTAWRSARLLHDGQGRLTRGVGVAALMALSCFGLHSVVDFNLQIPANALTFTVILALAWAAPAAAGTHKKRRRRKRAADQGHAVAA